MDWSKPSRWSFLAAWLWPIALFAATPYPAEATKAKTQYDRALGAAGAEYQRSAAAAQHDYEQKLAAARAEYNERVSEALATYIAALQRPSPPSGGSSSRRVQTRTSTCGSAGSPT